MRGGAVVVGGWAGGLVKRNGMEGGGPGGVGIRGLAWGGSGGGVGGGGLGGRASVEGETRMVGWSLSMVVRESRKRTTEARRLELGASSSKYIIPEAGELQIGKEQRWRRRRRQEIGAWR